MTPVFVPQAIKEGGALLDLATPTGSVAEELADSVPHRGDPLALILAYAGLV